jgi:hypothetical protein
MNSCFLCAPNKEWVYSKSSKFYSMLGLGPIVEGYSLIATQAHLPSMIDLSLSDVSLLIDFTANIRQILNRHFGQTVITEHGRVAPCVDPEVDRKDAHCFHAHRLVFPTEIDFTNVFSQHNLEVEEYSSFIECKQQFKWRGEYLYYERPNGSCLIASAPGKLARQFFRYKLADAIGHPELASWRDFPALKAVERARKKIFISEE